MSDGAISDRNSTALAHFKDWSNYLLVVTVAAVGWIAKTSSGNQVLMDLAVWALSLSLVFGIFSLALVPLIAEQIQSSDDSVYDVQVRFHLLCEFRFYLPQACRPQHILFIIGAILYCLATTDAGWENHIGKQWLPWGVLGLCVIAVVLGFLPWCHRRRSKALRAR